MTRCKSVISTSNKGVSLNIFKANSSSVAAVALLANKSLANKRETCAKVALQLRARHQLQLSKTDERKCSVFAQANFAAMHIGHTKIYVQYNCLPQLCIFESANRVCSTAQKCCIYRLMCHDSSIMKAATPTAPVFHSLPPPALGRCQKTPHGTACCQIASMNQDVSLCQFHRIHV